MASSNSFSFWNIEYLEHLIGMWAGYFCNPGIISWFKVKIVISMVPSMNSELAVFS